MKRKPLVQCPACRGWGNFSRDHFDGTETTTHKIRCGECRGYGMVSQLQSVAYWKKKRYGGKAQPRPEGV